MGYADYTKATGSGGIMLVRVADAAGAAGVISGNEVQFFLRTTNSATFVGSPGFGTSVYYNGGWAALANMANYSNAAGFRHLGTIYVGVSQQITFHINASGTSGFGGPTDFPVWVARGTIPPAPTPMGFDQITHTSFRYRFNSAGDGGAAIEEWQFGFGYNATTPQYFVASNGTSIISTIVPGTIVYGWSRGRNSVGWGPWSVRSTAVMKRAGRIKTASAWAHGIPYIKNSAGIWTPAQPYTKKYTGPAPTDGVWTIVAPTP